MSRPVLSKPFCVPEPAGVFCATVPSVPVVCSIRGWGVSQVIARCSPGCRVLPVYQMRRPCSDLYSASHFVFPNRLACFVPLCQACQQDFDLGTCGICGRAVPRIRACRQDGYMCTCVPIYPVGQACLLWQVCQQACCWHSYRSFALSNMLMPLCQTIWTRTCARSSIWYHMQVSRAGISPTPASFCL